MQQGRVGLLMTAEEHARRYRDEPVEARQEREALEDRAADHAPAGDYKSVRQQAAMAAIRDQFDEEVNLQAQTMLATAVLDVADRFSARNREALAVAVELRNLAGLVPKHLAPNADLFRNLADRLDGGRQ